MARQTKKTLSNYLQTGKTLLLFLQAQGLTDKQTVRHALRKKLHSSTNRQEGTKTTSKAQNSCRISGLYIFSETAENDCATILLVSGCHGYLRDVSFWQSVFGQEAFIRQ
jgi:hypothetical protein